MKVCLNSKIKSVQPTVFYVVSSGPKTLFFLQQMQAELDEIKRENFTLRSHLENKEEETATLANLLTSAEAQIELLYGALQK